MTNHVHILTYTHTQTNDTLAHIHIHIHTSITKQRHYYMRIDTYISKHTFLTKHNYNTLAYRLNHTHIHNIIIHKNTYS